MYTPTQTVSRRCQLISSLLALLLAMFVTSTSMANDISITEARASATPPGATVSAGYMLVTNNSDKDLIINGVSSDRIPKVELHLSVVKDDVASMIKQSSVTIPAGESLAFEHGGYHLMLMELENSLIDGSIFTLTLDTSAGEIHVLTRVTRQPGGTLRDMGGAGGSAMMPLDKLEHGGPHDEVKDLMKNGEHKGMKNGEHQTLDVK